MSLFAKKQEQPEVKQPEPIPELVRMTLESIDRADPDNLRADLADRAKAVLGYEPLSKEVDAQKMRNRIIACLREIELPPFSRQSVKAYRAAQVKQERNRLGPEARYVTVAWVATPLRSYEREIPEYALEAAIQIRDRVPEAGLWVDEIRIESTWEPFLVVTTDPDVFETKEPQQKQLVPQLPPPPRPQLFNPFDPLGSSLDGAIQQLQQSLRTMPSPVSRNSRRLDPMSENVFYVEVWDEPTFEAARTY